MKKRLLIIGLFSDADKYPITQASELAQLLKKNDYNVLTVSRFRNKLLRLIDIVSYIILKRNKFDISIVQFYSGNSLIWQSVACYLTKKINKKLVITIHGGGVPERIKLFPTRYLRVLKMADVITCPSNYIVDAVKEYHVDADLVENSISIGKYQFKNRGKLKPILLWMRGFSDLYNPEMAVKVVAKLKSNFPDVKLFMAGHNLGSKKRIADLISNLNLNENVEIIGYVNWQKKIAYAEMADIFISTNRVDNAPVSFTEMWALGLPVVSTNVGGIPFMIKDGYNGLLVNDNDVNGMTKKVTQLILSNETAPTIIHNAYNQVNKYSEDSVFKKWDNILCNI